MNDVWKVYKITGECGRGYVGLTKRGVLVRWKQHVRDSRNGADFLLHRAIRKYGESWFKIEELCECYSVQEARICERAMITVHNTFSRNGSGFNLTCGGDGNWGWVPKTETRLKIGAKSAARLAANPGHVRKMIAGRDPNQKRPYASAGAAAMGRAKKGIKLTQEHKNKISLAGTGRIKSATTIEKLRAARPKGIWKPSLDAVLKMSASKKGVPLSAAHREKISAGQRGTRRPPFSESHLAAMSASQKRRIKEIPGEKERLIARVNSTPRVLTPEDRVNLGKTFSKLNKSPEIKWRHSCTRNYEKALAALIGHERPYRLPRPSKEDKRAGFRVMKDAA